MTQGRGTSRVRKVAKGSSGTKERTGAQGKSTGSARDATETKTGSN